MKQKFALLFFCIGILFSQKLSSQEDKLNKAIELRLKNPKEALALMDSVIINPQTKNDYYVWTTRAYIYYEIYKKTDKLKLYSPLRDSILSSVRRSYQLNPDSETINNNKRMLKSLAAGYRKITKVLLEDSINFEKAEKAWFNYKKTQRLVDSTVLTKKEELDYYNAKLSVATNFYIEKWNKTNVADSNELKFVLDIEEEMVKKDINNKSSRINMLAVSNFFNSIEKKKYLEEITQKQIQLALSNQQNQLAQLKAQKQKDEIELLNSNMTISQFQVEKQKKNNELLEKEKKLQATLIEKQNLESKKKEEELSQQRFVRNISLGGILLLFVIIFLIYRNLSLNKKQNKIILSQKTEVENQNQIISKQKQLVEEKHKEITDSINYAERIQRSFLASKELLDENLNRVTSTGSVTKDTVTSSSEAYREGTSEISSRYVPQEASGTTRTDSSYFVFYQPKDVVSGDFYWAATSQWLDERASATRKLFYLCTADSTGHGVPGAIMSLLNIASLEKAIENNTSPAEILNDTRQTIIERLKKDGSAEGGKDGMDCSLIKFDFSNSKMTYAAANNPVWIVRGDEFLEFEADRMPVGKNDKDKIPFTEHEVELKKNDVVYTFTDGMPDQFGGAKGKKFMYKQLKELLISISQLPMPEQKIKIETSLKNWMGDNEQVDDITLIGIRV